MTDQQFTGPGLTVTIDEVGRNLMQALAVDAAGATGVVLATARRSTGHNDDEWVGWCVELDGQRAEVFLDKHQARAALRAKAEWVLEQRREQPLMHADVPAYEWGEL